MDLFDYMRNKNMESESPLASRLRPTSLDEVVGQEHIIGRDKLLYRAIKADKLSSIIFYGPPGTGKTTLAKVIANTTSAEFTQVNATSAGKKDLEVIISEAKNNQGMYGRKTILFIDEIHRFNKGQQDYLLPFVEDQHRRHGEGQRQHRRPRPRPLPVRDGRLLRQRSRDDRLRQEHGCQGHHRSLQALKLAHLL